MTGHGQAPERRQGSGERDGCGTSSGHAGSDRGRGDQRGRATDRLERAGAGGGLGRRRGGPAVSGALLWASKSVAVSPAGGAVFVTGGDYATVAYDPVTGAKLWASHTATNSAGSTSVAVSRDGGAVFVTGGLTVSGNEEDYRTIAYGAVTGAQLWASKYDGPGNFGIAFAVAASPDGRAVFVTGESAGSGGFEYAKVAYDAVTGAQLWARRYGGDSANARSLVVSPDGGTVYVTGLTYGGAGDTYATIAYKG